MSTKTAKLFQFMRETIAIHLKRGIFINQFSFTPQIYKLIENYENIFVDVKISEENSYSGSFQIGPDTFVPFHSKLNRLEDYIDL